MVKVGKEIIIISQLCSDHGSFHICHVMLVKTYSETLYSSFKF